jgi:hypothetical protein
VRVLHWTALGLAIVVVLAGGTSFVVARHIEGGITVQPADPDGPQPSKLVANAELQWRAIRHDNPVPGTSPAPAGPSPSPSHKAIHSKSAATEGCLR